MPKGFTKIFFICLGVLLLLLFIFGDGGPKPDEKKVEFTAIQPSQMRFRNIRSFFYDIKDFPEDLQAIYRLSSRVTFPDSVPHLTFAIIINRKHNEAFVMPELSPFFDNYDSLQLRWSGGAYTYRKTGAEDAWIFSAHVYKALLNEQQFEFFDKKIQAYRPMMADGLERQKLKITLKDYFTLASKY
jgi:hypothetical protein